MDISISNIAWNTNIDKSIAESLKLHGVRFIDIAPTKYFNDIANTSYLEVESIRSFWLNYDIKPLGLQSLLYGTNGLNIFSTQHNRSVILQYLDKICEIGSWLGAKKLTFGSPSNRYICDLKNGEVLEVALNFFCELGDIANKHGVCICIEPAPHVYGGNFLVNSQETADFIELLSHKNIRMQLDIGIMNINHEDPHLVLPKIRDYIEHVHISDPNLTPLGLSSNFHLGVSRMLKLLDLDIPFTIEILTSSDLSSLSEVEESIRFVKEIYSE